MTIATVSAILVLSVCPIAGGFLLPFSRQHQKNRLTLIFSFAPALLAASGVAIIAGLQGDGATLLIILAALTVPALMFIVGRAFGKPFAEIWRERTQTNIADTFD